MTNKKELNLDELDAVTGGSYTFNEVDAKGRAEFIGMHVEIHYLRHEHVTAGTMNSEDRSHGGKIVDVKSVIKDGIYQCVVKVQFDGWPYHGWYWWERIWNNVPFSSEQEAEGKELYQL